MNLPQTLTTLLLLTLLAALPLCQTTFNPTCTDPQVHRFLVVSQAKIEKSKNLEYSLTLLDTPVYINKTAKGISFSGNFSKLVLKNTQTKKETIYEGRQMVFKMPANHVFNLQKIPDLQVQINHHAINPDEDTPIPFIMFSQTYMQTQFTSNTNTILSNNIHKNIKNGDIVKTKQIIKILEGFPMLMYRGSTESYPCRSDLLCFLKRQYQLISSQDFNMIKEFLYKQPISNQPKKAFKRKNLFQVHPIKRYNTPVRSHTSYQETQL